jgi:hypothetical protein
VVKGALALSLVQLPIGALKEGVVAAAEDGTEVVDGFGWLATPSMIRARTNPSTTTATIAPLILRALGRGALGRVALGIVPVMNVERVGSFAATSTLR